VLSSYFQSLLPDGSPILQEPYGQEPFLVDEDRIGRSAIAPLLAGRGERLVTPALLGLSTLATH